MPFSGGVSRELSLKRTITGELSAEGAGSGVGGFRALLEGILTFTGEVASNVLLKRNVSGKVSFSGDTNRVGTYSRLLGGVLSFKGRIRILLNGLPLVTGIKKGLRAFGLDFLFK